jgi:hypothetical protein
VDVTVNVCVVERSPELLELIEIVRPLTEIQEWLDSAGEKVSVSVCVHALSLESFCTQAGIVRVVADVPIL